MAIKRVKEITAEEENFRTEQLPPNNFNVIRRDSIEPVPVGTYVVKIFKVTGYDKDCDGSLMARLENITKEGESTGWDADSLSLYPESSWIVESPNDIDNLAKE